MSLPLVVITRAVPVEKPDAQGRPVIPGCDVVMHRASPQLSRAELLGAVRGAHAVVSMFHDRVDDEFLDAAGPQLRAVCNFAVGVDNIDLTACRRRGVIVTNTPDAVTEGTANMTWALILAVARRLGEGDRFVRSGRFEREGNGFPIGWCGMHLTGQQLLIVGPGRIGRAVALRALAFGMRILYCTRGAKLDWELAPLCAQRVELDEGLARADVVSVHTPLTPQTRHILNRQNMACLKPTAIVINTSRGPTIDEAALYELLRERKIWGAGLDVFEHEPKVHPGLAELDNVTLAPHMGSAETKYRQLMCQIACDNAGVILAGRGAITPV